MTTTPTHTQSLKTNGSGLDGLHFRKTLENIVRVRPRYPVDTWTTGDAADFWLPNYDYRKANPLSPFLIVAVAHRLAAAVLYHHPKFNPFIEAARHSGAVFLTASSTEYAATSWSLVLRRMYQSCQWKGGSQTSMLPAFSPTYTDGSNVLRPGTMSYCHRSSCKKQNSFTGGCISEEGWDRLRRSGQVVPWSSVNWGGFGCWFTPARAALDEPYIAIQRARSHVTEKYITRDVADTLRDFHELMPYQMLQLADCGSFTATLREYVETLEGERLRYYGMVVHNPNCDAAMEYWDKAFTAHCWMFGTGNTNQVYANYDNHTWQIDWDKFSAISQNQISGCFPDLPKPVNP